MVWDREQMRDENTYSVGEKEDYKNIHTGIYPDDEVFINYDNQDPILIITLKLI